MREKWFHSIPSTSQCIQKWGLQCTINLEQSAMVYFMEFKPPHLYRTSLLLQMPVELTLAGSISHVGIVCRVWKGTLGAKQFFSVFYLRVCWDQVKLSSWVKCLAFCSGPSVSAGDMDKPGKAVAARTPGWHGSCRIKNQESSLRSSLALKSATVFTRKIRQMMSLFFSFFSYRCVTGGKEKIKYWSLDRHKIINIISYLMQFIK